MQPHEGFSRLSIGFGWFVKKELTETMNFGARLGEERRRLKLKQAEFAALVGTDVPKQSLYENGKRELRADYLARLSEAGVDVVYVLTGRRAEGDWLSGEASELLSAYLALPPDMQRAVTDLASAIRTKFAAESAPTLHAKRLAYRAEEPR